MNCSIVCNDHIKLDESRCSSQYSFFYASKSKQPSNCEILKACIDYIFKSNSTMRIPITMCNQKNLFNIIEKPRVDFSSGTYWIDLNMGSHSIYKLKFSNLVQTTIYCIGTSNDTFIEIIRLIKSKYGKLPDGKYMCNNNEIMPTTSLSHCQFNRSGYNDITFIKSEKIIKKPALIDEPIVSKQIEIINKPELDKKSDDSDQIIIIDKKKNKKSSNNQVKKKLIEEQPDGSNNITISNITSDKSSSATISDKKPTKKKKQTIPQATRAKVWDHHIGMEFGSKKCMCCKINGMTQLNFVCGHVQSEEYGGTLSVDNLRPICGTCNSSMGTRNMREFMKSSGLGELDKLDVLPEVLHTNLCSSDKLM
jgi:5-methylcytosine-specific restriction endonuclease McrA